METLTSYHAQRQISDKFKASFKINQKNVGRYDMTVIQVRFS